MIAANYNSKHPVLGILTNLVNRFILAYIKKVDNTDSQVDQAGPAKKPKTNQCEIEIFDTAQVSLDDGCDYAFKNPREFACLLISYWLSKCSTDKNFDNKENPTRFNNVDPYDVNYFYPFYTTLEHLRGLFDTPNKNNDEDFQMFLEQMNAVCESKAERAAFIRDRLLSEFSSYYDRFESRAIEHQDIESRTIKHNSMYS